MYKTPQVAFFEAQAKEKAMKKQYRHDWLIAIFSTLGGAIAGFITSLIFWAITK